MISLHSAFTSSAVERTRAVRSGIVYLKCGIAVESAAQFSEHADVLQLNTGARIVGRIPSSHCARGVREAIVSHVQVRRINQAHSGVLSPRSNCAID